MVFRKLIFVAFLVLEGCCVFSQYVVAPGTCSCVSSSPITPVGQFVIPAIIKPMLQPEPIAVPSPTPVVPSYSDVSAPGGLPAQFPMPFGGMPPIIVDDDNDRSNSLLYCIILALSRRNRSGGNGNGYGSGGFGSGGFGSGGCGNGCGGGYGGYGGSNECGSSNNGCNGGCNGGSNYNNNGCGGSDGNNGYGMNYGSCGCGGFNGNGCGNSCIFIPYPMPVPCGSSTIFPTFDCGCSNDNSCSCAQGNQTPEINLIIRTQDECSTCDKN